MSSIRVPRKTLGAALLTLLVMVFVVFVKAGAPVAEPRGKSGSIAEPSRNYLHAPTLVQLPSGDIVAAWYEGSGEEMADDVYIAASVYDGSKWSVPSEVADTPNVPDTNPVLIQGRDGSTRIMWSIVLANDWGTTLLNQARLVSNSNHQLVWDRGVPVVFPFCRPLSVPPEDGCQAADKGSAVELRLHQRLGWMGRAVPLKTKNGLLLPLYNSNTLESIIAFSGDQGAHWSARGRIPGRGGIQGSLGERSDGTIVGFFRDSRKTGHVLVSESLDGGRTFGPLAETSIPNPNAGVQLLVLKDGRWLMFNNNSATVRSAIHVNISFDEGRTWPCASVIDDERPGGRIPWYAYPAAIQAANGDIHLLYSAQWYSAKDSHDRLSAIRHRIFKEDAFKDCRAGAVLAAKPAAQRQQG